MLSEPNSRRVRASLPILMVTFQAIREALARFLQTGDVPDRLEPAKCPLDIQEQVIRLCVFPGARPLAPARNMILLAFGLGMAVAWATQGSESELEFLERLGSLEDPRESGHGPRLLGPGSESA